MNIFKRTILYSLFLQIFSLAVQAQNNQGFEMAKLRTDIVPHSPEAEAMAKYAVLPVTLYSGMPQVSVPVYEIKTRNLDIPISLSYNYNGFKPTEMASSAGMGWSVQGGGVITRIVKGKVDEDGNVTRHYQDLVDMNSTSDRQAVLKNIADGTWDSEPDLYIFNFPGHSGKFILMKGKAYVFPYQNIRINAVSGGFLITTEEGNQYYFQDSETTYHHNTSGDVFIPNHLSAWYLSEIVSEDKTDTVQYSYSSYSYHQVRTYMEDFSVYSDNSTNLQKIYFDGDNITTKVLSSISSKNASISFGADTAARHDLTGSSGAHPLSFISIAANGGTGSSYAKKVQLVHSYFSDSARLSLKGVNIISGQVVGGVTTYTTDTLKYLFDYEDETSDYPNETDAIDMYGYYNGGSNAWLFPSGYFTPHSYGFADRSGQYSYSKRGILKKMTYPTGGYSTFAYEQNQNGHYNILTTYTTVDSTLTVPYDPYNNVGGVTGSWKVFTVNRSQYAHIYYSTSSESPPYPSIPILKLYTQLSGIGAQPGTLLYTAPVLSALPTGSDSIYLESGKYIFYVYCPSGFTNDFGEMQFRAYDISNTLTDGPGLRIKQITFFDSTSSTDTALIKQYSYNAGTELVTDGIGSRSLTHKKVSSDLFETTYQSGLKSALSQLQDEQFYYKQATEINRDFHKAGKTDYTFNSFGADVPGVFLEKQLDYSFKDTGYILLKSESNVYGEVDKFNFSTFKVALTQFLDGASTLIPTPDETQPVEGVDHLYATTGVTNLTSFYKVLLSKTEKVYDQTGANPAMDSSSYYYDNSDHSLPSRIITLNSKGDTLITQLKYPLDYNFGSSCGSLTTLDTTFYNDKLAAMNSYVNSCISSLMTALAPYEPYVSHITAFTNVTNSYHCESDFKTYSDSVWARRDTAWNNYINCLTSAISSNSVAWQKAVLLMQKSNIISPVIEKVSSIKRSGQSEYLLGATRNDYNIFTVNGSVQTVLPVGIDQVETTGGILKSSFASSSDSYYKPQISYGYDSHRNLSLQKKNNDLNDLFLWNYHDMLPVASVTNADTTDVAYTSFEGDSKGNWSYSGSPTVDSGAITGIMTDSLSHGSISKSGLNSSATYIVSYWSKSGSQTVSGSGSVVTGRTVGSWTYYEHPVANPSGGTITVSGSGIIDELRLYPKGAQMVTYTYDPLIGMSSQCDVVNRISYFEYDASGRLVRVKDQDKNVIKVLDYQYKQSQNQ